MHAVNGQVISWENEFLEQTVGVKSGIVPDWNHIEVTAMANRLDLLAPNTY